MNNIVELSEEAIEEGRIALLQLERELKERENISSPTGNDAVSESKHHASTNERKMLDKMPRGARLTNRLESLGLTVEVRIFIFTRVLFLYLCRRFLCSFLFLP